MTARLRRWGYKPWVVALMLAAMPVITAFCDGPGRHGPW